MQTLNGFIKYLKALGYHEKTIKGHEYHLAKYLLWQTENKDSSALAYKTYLESRPNKRYGGGLSEACIYGNLRSVQMYFSYQLEMGIIERNPMSSLLLPRRNYKSKHLATQEELQQIYKSCENYFERSLFGIYYGCGLRRSEGEALNISDINFGSGVLVVKNGKGSKRRVVPLSNGIKKDFQHYLMYERKGYGNADSEAFLLNNEGGRLTGMVANKKLKQIVSRSGLTHLLPHAHLHWLRVQIGSHLLDRGMSIEFIRQLLGHSSIDTTGQYYTKVRQQRINSLSQSGN